MRQYKILFAAIAVLCMVGNAADHREKRVLSAVDALASIANKMVGPYQVWKLGKILGNPAPLKLRKAEGDTLEYRKDDSPLESNKDNSPLESNKDNSPVKFIHNLCENYGQYVGLYTANSDRDLLERVMGKNKSIKINSEMKRCFWGWQYEEVSAEGTPGKKVVLPYSWTNDAKKPWIWQYINNTVIVATGAAILAPIGALGVNALLNVYALYWEMIAS